MKRLFCPLLLGMLLVLPAVGFTEETQEGELQVGVWDADVDGSPDVVSEYETTDGGVDLQLRFTSALEAGFLDLDLDWRDDDDQMHRLAFDLGGRQLRSSTEFLKLFHRLGHDPLSNLEAATNHGRYVHHTDLDPAADYELTYSDLRHRTEFQPRDWDALTLALLYRRQEREGQYQALTISHCDSCHVYSQSRPLDESTEDVGVEVSYAWQHTQLRASYVRRELREGVRDIDLLFDDALQPELRVPVFDNRLQWDSAQGPQPVHQRPDTSKDIAKLTLSFARPGGLALDASGVWSQTENELTGLSAHYDGYAVNAVHTFHERWKLRWRGRYTQIDSDDIFVDIAEPPGIAGPHAGRTFRDVYGFDPDYLRQSALDREIFDSKLDLTTKLPGKAGRVRLLWEYEDLRRDHYEVALGETDTTENVLGLRWWARPRQGLRLSAGYRHGQVDHPFATVDGAFSTLVSSAAPSPFAPTAAQYYEFQDARVADTTAAAESWDEVKLGGTYATGKSNFSASYTWWDGDNDGSEDLDFTDWSRTHQSFTATLWWAPAETWQWYGSYAWHDTELKYPSFIPIFDG